MTGPLFRAAMRTRVIGRIAVLCGAMMSWHAPGIMAADTVYPATDYSEQRPGKPGGTLSLSVEQDTATLDFHAISHGNVQWLGRIMFDNLTYLDAQGRVSPWLATSWDISPDGLTYTFHLRHDVTFSDGTPFDAEAVRVNLDHMRDPRTKAQLTAAYISPYVDGRVVDRYTFEAHLREPYGPFLNVLAQSWLSMVSPRQIRENPEQIATHPIGSGPFVLSSYIRQRGLRFVRRNDYHWSPEVLHHPGPAYLEKINLDIVPETLSRYLSLISGQYDGTLDFPRQSVPALDRDGRFVFVTRIRTGLPLMAIGFNLDREPFRDVRVRRALAHAVDRAGLAHSVFFDENTPTSVFLARNTRFFDTRWNDVLAYDPDKANRLLDEAGYTARDAQGYRVRNGRRLQAQLVMLETPLAMALAVAVQDNFKAVGFDLTSLKVPPSNYTARRYNGNYQAISAGYWHTNTPDALYILFDSSEIPSGKRIGQNTAHLRDPELDGWLDEARRSSDPQTQARLYGLAQQRLVEDVPEIPLGESQIAFSYNRKVHGITYDTSHNTPIFTTAWLEN